MLGVHAQLGERGGGAVRAEPVRSRPVASLSIARASCSASRPESDAAYPSDCTAPVVRPSWSARRLAWNRRVHDRVDDLLEGPDPLDAQEARHDLLELLGKLVLVLAVLLGLLARVLEGGAQLLDAGRDPFEERLAAGPRGLVDVSPRVAVSSATSMAQGLVHLKETVPIVSMPDEIELRVMTM